MFRNIYETATNVQESSKKNKNWYKKIEQCKYDSSITTAESIKNHQETILAFFISRKTNALAEN